MSLDTSDPLTRRATARVGQTLRGKWRLDRLLGVGGMASVYEATHRNGKRGAVKMLHPEQSIDSSSRERFLREGYVANQVEHPGVVSVLDDDVADDGAVFLVMELLDGESLEARRAARPDARLGVDEVAHIAEQLLEVLVVAHARGVVHRDLKPENLFMTRHGQVKVLDFGIARLRELSQQSGATKTGSMMGTPTFMPPEQALGQWSDVDARSDVWAVGASMFMLLAGRTVHQADSLNKLLLAAMTQPAPPLLSVMPSAPPTLAAVIDRALAFDQRQRWQSAGEMLQALRAARTGAFPPAPAARALDGNVPPTLHSPAAPLHARGSPIGPPPAVAVVPALGQLTAAPVSATFDKPARPRTSGVAIAGGVALGLLLVAGGVFAALRGGEASGPAPAVGAEAPPGAPSAAPEAPSAVEPTPTAVSSATAAPSESAAPPASSSAGATATGAASQAPPVAAPRPGVARPTPDGQAKPLPKPPTRSSANPFDRW